MKRVLTFLPGVIALLGVVSACKMTEQEQEPGKAAAEKVYPVHFVADEIETRTVFGEAVTSGGQTSFPTLWTDNDSQIAVSLNLNPAKGATVTPAADYKSATFDADFSQSEVSAPFTFYALSPYSAYVGASSSHRGYHFNIQAGQTPLATSCDEAAQVMVASRDVESIADFSGVDLHFSHVTAYGRMTLKNMNLPEGARILSIDVTASEPFAGQFYYDFENNALEQDSPSRTVSLRTDNITVEAGTSSDIWFACAPADLGGGTLKVDVNTTTGVLSRTVQIGAGKLAFQRGRISKFGVNMESAVFTPVSDRWVLVTDASTLAAGDEIIITNSATAGAAYAMSTTQNTNSRGYTSVEIAQESDGKFVVKNPSNFVEHFMLVAGTGTYSSCFRLKDATDSSDGFLSAGNSYSDNYLLTGTNNDQFDHWVITSTDQGTVISAYGTVRSGNKTAYRHIRFNSDRFSTYKSSSRTEWKSSTAGTSPVYIFRKEAGVNPDTDPILEQEVYGAYLAGVARVLGAGDQQSREYMGDGTVTFAILTPSAYEVAEFSGIPISPAKGDTFTLHYNLIQGRNQADTDYNVTVVKVDGPKVWLSTGNGNGFIVKK